ncbi:MAG: DUF4274 domain-containing protein [Solobacterium sp.]|nr:DUF4274 domain-containing protein [Solobacterium sp.]
MNRDGIEKLLYSESSDTVKKYLSSCKETDTLHIYTYNYNWDNGFDIPRTIINNAHCSLSTALMMFYLADGFRYLTERNELTDSSEWQDFMSDLFTCIVNDHYKDKSIQFTTPLTKVQLFKLKKILTDSEQILITPIEGKDLNIEI